MWMSREASHGSLSSQVSSQATSGSGAGSWTRPRQAWGTHCALDLRRCATAGTQLIARPHVPGLIPHYLPPGLTTLPTGRHVLVRRAHSHSYDKLVKGATKPKQDLPKPKYIDPILASAYGKDGGLQDVFRSLSYRLQDPNSTVRDPAHRQVVFKTLIVVHTLMRSDASVTVLSYLAGDPSALRLKRVAMGGLLEYTYSRTLTRYATYLEYRITTFKELGYDLVQASKRDRFARLRKMSVSKGLLREIAMLQRLMNALLECSVGRHGSHSSSPITSRMI